MFDRVTPMKFNTLKEFTAEVNRIFQSQHCFGHNPQLPERLFEDEFKAGKTPKQVVRRMNKQAEAEWAAEARMS